MVNTVGIERNHGGKKVNVNKSLNETNVMCFSGSIWCTSPIKHYFLSKYDK